MAERVPARLSAAAGRRFGLTVGGAFVVLAAIAAWRGWPVVSAVAGVLGLGLTIAGLAIPTRLGPVERGWMRLAAVISRVTTPIVMGVLYFVVITPVGLLTRIFGHHPLTRPPGAGVWVARAPGAHRSDLTRQF